MKSWSKLLIASSLISAGALGCCCGSPAVSEPGDRTGLRDQLVEMGRSRISFIESRAAAIKAEPTPQDAQSLSNYIRQHPDHTSYICLLYLRLRSPESYNPIDGSIKARVFASSLANVKCLNDWGCLYPSPYDTDVAKELVGLGSVALDSLTPLLSDKRRAYLCDFGGSEWSSRSNRFGFRICDYACRYISQIKGLEPTFKEGIPQRDIEIEDLRARLMK